ncbi:MAG: SO_0444 family Cu/Zn efflux transporter [Helicobacteraceae bacterium]|nr:SO_0444 family Cu/Zn efflux transporter [Candidatus Sulfurimonas ponti]MBL6973133.1 SO_0444 family Cu/Zn efflux transporter [Sulfurimonas sp.]
MEYITLFFDALVALSHAMSPYILFGLVFAGVLHELVPESIVTKHLGKENILSVIKSTLFGIPLPVCSCGVIPLATSIKKSGASKGATLSFLISTPITGVDSILATYGMFGWIFTLYRVITSMIIATIAGILTNFLDKEKPKPAFSAFAPNKAGFSVASVKPKVTESCCSNTNQEKKAFSIQKVFSYSFGTLLKDIAKPLFYGLILGALITIAIPQNLSAIIMDNAWASYLIAIAIAVPLYVCATASLPIAAALMIAGVSPGAAFVFLTAGPATNTVTIGVVKSMLGKTSLIIYLSTIVLGSMLFGLGLDYIFDSNSIDASKLIHIHEEIGLIEIISSTILWALIIYYIAKPYLKKA